MGQKKEWHFFTKGVVIFSIFLGFIFVYSYIIWNSIQPQLSVVGKIYTWISSSTESISWENKTINYWFDITSNIEIQQENTIIFDGKLDIKNAEIYANGSWLEQKISADWIELNINKDSDKIHYKITDLDIISQDENIYLYSQQNLEKIFTDLTQWKYPKYSEILKKIFSINKKRKFAHIDNSQAIKNNLSNLDENHWINKILTSLVTSNPKKYFEKNKLINILKQNIYNDKWIEYFFIENTKISDEKKKFFIINKEICTQISPFLEKINFSGIGEIQKKWNSYNQCVTNIQEINPFIALATQIYKFWDIENWNYDFVISQWNQLDIKFTYTNHILQDWNIFIQNPEKTIKISLLWDKFWIKESQILIDYIHEKTIIRWDIINGTGDISVKIDNKHQQISGDIIFQNYLLIDMALKWKWTSEKWEMMFSTSWDYKVWKIDYRVIKEKETIQAFNLNYADQTYKIDYISPTRNFNFLSDFDTFILGLAEKNEDKTIKKEIKYVYDQWHITWHYRTSDLEWNLEWEILSENNFQLKIEINKQDEILKLLLESQEKSNFQVKYTAKWTLQDEVLFELNADKITQENIIKIKFSSEFIKNEIKNNYRLPEKIEQIDINLDQIIVLPNFHQIIKFWW